MIKKIKTTVGIIIIVAILLFGVPFGIKGGKFVTNYLNSSNFKLYFKPAVDSSKPLTDQTLPSQILKIKNNHAEFTESDLSLTQGSWQHFSDLDGLNRVGQANAMLGSDLMPHKKREPLTWQPTGFHNKNIGEKSDSGWLYDRCHLIGYQLTGENNNPKNLMTGTRSLNTPMMTKFENEVAQYIKTTKHHVRYRVTPVFKANELVARGVQMQGQSVEDKTINFNIYIQNVQDNVTIDYQTGYSTINNQ
ncbi:MULTISPECIES: DNA/RNA non-specific endonuclease [Latilactobacillus]|uniref:Type VII secretion system protein EssD-like domain-containing protein n=1 Tax=Latilactobacillus curvatus TaxID=28038 RepID=A0ABM7QWC1_LATCU|nr:MULTISPECIES: DNA/RNA non-specific endonuclease [Latilactobacillus]ASN13624.1 hypothetical protein B4V05_10355 [Latilactobacillus sakei]KGB13913.1 hypothetical protein KY41_10440 [Latilactobacillus sakei]MCW8780655.1 DNA/RNA non-specific endonuclease [Latilactobacillus curvatus]UTB73255.1 hypothetical protein A4W72_10880 [Latilactobacillus curvatus]BCX31497.1 hypothetical protein LTWDN19_20640 [Latilactobacillus curvatus]